MLGVKPGWGRTEMKIFTTVGMYSVAKDMFKPTQAQAAQARPSNSNSTKGASRLAKPIGQGWLTWSAVNAVTWVLAFIIAEIIPFFSDMLSLLSIWQCCRLVHISTLLIAHPKMAGSVHLLGYGISANPVSGLREMEQKTEVGRDSPQLLPHSFRYICIDSVHYRLVQGAAVGSILTCFVAKISGIKNCPATSISLSDSAMR
ncbi:hypothetical protein DFH09DRAFT_1106164 [Mycena vulgaris]|nr:hypothetical protein DFH09DRAFT_1106164 [Mycena vulgaris]